MNMKINISLTIIINDLFDYIQYCNALMWLLNYHIIIYTYTYNVDMI